MKRVIGAAMMVDGVLQSMGVAGLVSTIADRSWSDRALFAGHLLVGAGLVFVGRTLLNREGGSTAAVAVLAASLALSAIETTWFNWTDVSMRAAYTAVALVIVLRKTTLPTT